MAKITELVKTYRLLSDPNAPDWNVKFAGAAFVALALIAAAGALVWSASQANEPTAPAAASAESAQKDCDPAEIAAEMNRLGATSLPSGHALPSGCLV